MKNSFVALVCLIIVGILLSKMFLYQVRYDQRAVVSTFDKADDDSIETEPGLKFRLPWPINKVHLYSTRLQLMEDKMEEIQTADGKTVIVRTYLAWRIENPLEFFRTLKETREANKQLSARLREIRGIISRYRFDQLFNTRPEQFALASDVKPDAAPGEGADGDAPAAKQQKQTAIAKIERDALTLLNESLSTSKYGIKVERVGIYQIELPANATDAVFETMIETRNRLAENARQEGQSQASAIRSEAENARDRILAFANRRAQTIRTVGDREAAENYQEFAKNEDFAIFLRKLDALKKMLSHNTTFVLNANNLSILKPLVEDPAKDAPASKGGAPTTRKGDAANAEQGAKGDSGNGGDGKGTAAALPR